MLVGLGVSPFMQVGDGRAATYGWVSQSWSTGERLAVALVLGDHATLDNREGYTRQEAVQRLSGDIAFYGYAADTETWITGIRAAL